ncbi:universal stress protein [Motiliproteus sediminis]|uniref:universal stress protein n=1 Tax=Motiliproteus sediminis TaxID=1468178 RepID=UPI001AEF7A2F|nr:universal stress protein [Motiliproteus sediminis]
MKPLRNILYFADGDMTMNPALERAISLAYRHEARLTVMDVIGNLPSPAAVKIRFGLGIDEIIRQYQEQELRKLLQHAAPLNHPVRIDVRTGWGFIEAIRAVINEPHELLIKPARNGADQPLSSSDMHLLRKCPCPVWIERGTEARNYRTILAAVDPCSEEDDCADTVTDLAYNIAKADGSRLALVHAWQFYGESMLRSGRYGLSDVELEKMREQTRQQHSSQLRALLERHQLGSDEVELHLHKGEPTEVIQRVAEQLKADLIVIGTLARTGIPGLIIGNTAEDILQRSDCSVLAVKPGGFVSPVKSA